MAPGALTPTQQPAQATSLPVHFLSLIVRQGIFPQIGSTPPLKEAVHNNWGTWMQNLIAVLSVA